MSIFDGIKKKKTTDEETVVPAVQDTAAEPKKRTKATPKSSVASTTGVKNGQAGVILAPVISEKAAHQAAVNQYVFHVHPSANKVMVKQAVKMTYKVDPISVNIIKVEGKKVRRGRMVGKQADYKKAIVTVKSGQKIDLYQGV